jgi:hypothetical protein
MIDVLLKLILILSELTVCYFEKWFQSQLMKGITSVPVPCETYFSAISEIRNPTILEISVR